MILDHEVPLIEIFPKIKNRNIFLKKSHPRISPELEYSKYVSYWREEKRRCIEGFWGEEEENSWRYASPDIYFYANHWLITEQRDDGTEVTVRPSLRQSDWHFFCTWLVCRKFSGFMDDDECNGHYLLKKYWEKGGDLDETDQHRLSKAKYVKNHKGEYKKYRDPYEILADTYAFPLGLPCYENPAQDMMCMSSRGVGKDLEENTVVHTADGPVPIKDIQVGDKIFGADGKLTTVISKDNYYDQLQYEVTFSDGRKIECGAGHLWNVHKKQRSLEKYPTGYEYCTKTLGDIYKDYKIGKRGDSRYFIDICKPLEYEEKDLPVDPYFFGLWLGDGNSHNVGITSQDEEIIEECYRQAKIWGKQVAVNQNKSKTCATYTLTNGMPPVAYKNEILNAFRDLNVLNNKHIPDIYLRSSFDQRLALLQGLMDSDGYIKEKRSITLSSSYEGIQNTFGILLSSLGIRFKKSWKKTTHKDSLRFRLFTDLPVFRLPRKAEKLGKSNSKYATTNRTKSAIVNIKPTSVKPSVCIGVDNEDSLFVAGENHIVTHNSFWASSIAAREFTFNGARYYNRKNGEHENEVEISQESGKVFCSSYEEKYVDLLYTKIFSGLDNFSGEYKTMEKAYPPPFYKWRQGTFGGNSNVVAHTYTVRYPIGGKRTKGSRSAMYKGVYSNGINQAIGNRVNIGIIDEAGLILNLKEVHGANRNVMERGGVKAGSLLYTGTGGDITKIEGSKSMFHNPKQNRLYSMPNKWEDTDEISMFIPAEYSLKEFWDENGNTNLELARKELLKRRKVAAEGNDSIQYNMERMYMPLKPSDIFLVDGGLIFMQDKIMSRLSDISRLDNWRQNASFGEIKCFGNRFDDVQIRRGRFENERPIVSRSVGEMDNTKGCIIFYREPEGTDSFRMKGSRYRITYDPVRREGSEVNRYRSFASILVWDTKERQIAAEFIGRRDTPEEVHDICLNLAIYYNCPILAETNVSGFKNAAKKRGLAFMLYPTPIEALSKKVAGLKYSPGDVGVEMTGKIKPASIEFAQDFMNRKDENGICLYDTLNSLRLLEEMEVWDGESNADHISAFLLLAIWEEEEREGVIMQPANPQSKYTEFKKIMSEQRLSRQIYSAMYRT